MAEITTRRIALCTLSGGVVWAIWSTFVNLVILVPKYAVAQKAGWMLAQPRYSLFVVYWIVMLFVLAHLLTWLYVSVGNTLGPGPLTALRIGLFVGFMIGFPINLALAAWAPFSRVIPLWWMLDLWVGSVLATLVSGWICSKA